MTKTKTTTKKQVNENASRDCPCGSGLEREQCCLLYIDAQQSAPSAQALMRSRYTAYTLLRHDYILRTWHPDQRPQQLHLDESIRWSGLKIKHCKAGLASDSVGEVEFIARFKIAGRADRIHENSRFIKLSGHWFYIDGQIKHQPKIRPGHET